MLIDITKAPAARSAVCPRRPQPDRSSRTDRGAARGLAPPKSVYFCVASRRRRIELRRVSDAAVFFTYAPPAITLLQLSHFQMPTATRLTLTLPQNSQKYLLCCATSIFLMRLRSIAP